VVYVPMIPQVEAQFNRESSKPGPRTYSLAGRKANTERDDERARKLKCWSSLKRINERPRMAAPVYGPVLLCTTSGRYIRYCTSNDCMAHRVVTEIELVMYS
jgi:hypothetical protein